MYKIYSVFLVLLLAATANASNFGSAEKTNFISLKNGESAKFTVLLWTSDAGTKKILLDVTDSPQNMSVIAPKSVDIGEGHGSEMVFVSGKYIMATPVDITVIPYDSPPGVYTVTVSALVLQSGGEVDFLQERMFKLTFEILGDKKDVKNTDTAAGMNTQVEEPSLTAETGENSNGNATIAIIILITAFISFLIYIL